MFYPESGDIAAKHPELGTLVQRVDRLLGELGEGYARLEQMADLLGTSPSAVQRLLRLYEAQEVVEETSIALCPRDGEIVEARDEGALWCDICEEEHQPEECEHEIAYRVRPERVIPPRGRGPAGTSVRIFVSYAREDAAQVEELYQRLRDAGFEPWMDTKDILPGEQWELCIEEAIRGADFFLACLSRHSVSKRGWIQRELKRALDIWEEKLESDIYLIPVRLETCEVPRRLGAFQWVDLFEEDGWARLEQAIRTGMERRFEETGHA